MAALLPSIDSDEEFTAPSNVNDDDENDGGDKMDTSFQFGGILVRLFLLIFSSVLPAII